MWLLIFLFFNCLIFQPVIAEDDFQSDNSSARFNLSITREDFADFYDTLILPSPEESLELADIYFDTFDLTTGKLKGDEIFSAKNAKFEPDIFNTLQKDEEEANNDNNDSGAIGGNGGIYNVKLAGNTGASSQKGSGLYSMIGSNPKATGDLCQNSNSEACTTIKKLKEANKLITNNGNSEKVRGILAELEKTSAKDAVNLSNIAKLYMKLNDTQKACGLLKQATELSPDDYKILYTYAISLYKNKDYELAEKNLLKINGLKPDFMFAYYNLGNIYYKKKDYHKAVESFKKAMELSPDNSDIYFNLAASLEMLNYKDLAIKFYTKCLNLNPNDKEASKALERINY